jgi:hypothetical protein
MMTPTEQRLAIAEFDGWKERKRDGGLKSHWLHPDGKTLCSASPDYLHDLNAIHGAVMKLETIDKRWAYLKNLNLITGSYNGLFEGGVWCWQVAEATAPQRCEALCRTLRPERWKD